MQEPGENTEPTEEAKIDVENIKQEEEEETVKPPADLFKAIFLDSESDSDDDNDTAEAESAPAPVARPPVQIPANNPSGSGPKPWEEKEGNILRNKEPARGIFANIDLDSLNRRGPAEKIKNRSAEQKTEKPVAKGSTGNISVTQQTLRTVLGIRNEPKDSSSDDEYGPRLPDSMLPAQASIVISSDSEDDELVRKNKKTKKSKKGKKHKEKKKRKDVKKKKKHVARSDSSSSSSRSRSRSRDHKYKKRKRSYSRHS